MNYEQENDGLGSKALKIAQDPKTSSEELVELVVKGGADSLLSVAEELVIHPNATPELYELLADNKWWLVRYVVGGLPFNATADANYTSVGHESESTKSG